MTCLFIQPSNMDHNALEGRIFPEQLKLKLAQKRKALDSEIERFMAQKDAEFRRFEKELRSQLRETGNNEASQTPSTIVARGFTVASPAATTDKAISQGEAIQSPQDTTLTDDVESAGANLKQTTSGHSPNKDIPPGQDGDIELDPLPRSTYVPRLPPTSNITNHRRTLSDDSAAWISTSLDTQDKHSDVERPSMAMRRSSSSPTGTGRSSRKSSMKRPDSSDSTRRKHVLFSIDDQLISPTSSPVNHRSARSEHPPIPFTGLRDFYTEPQISPSITEAGQSRDKFPPQTLSQSPSSFSKSYKDLVVPTVITPPEELEEEDLHSGIKDLLFDSDELPGPPVVEDDWNLSPVESQSENEEGMTAASPHAASVPIRIRQPYKDLLSR